MASYLSALPQVTLPPSFPPAHVYQEELADGLHMIDFEQLKISNVDLTEKVEERNEDISKLTRKVRGTVEVLTHVKEKLHFLQVYTNCELVHSAATCNTSS